MSWQQQAQDVAKALVVAVGSAYNVATGDIEKAASTIATQYPGTHARQVEAEIRRHIRK